MTDLSDLPTIAEPPPALPATTDLKKVDLQAVALVQFGDWRADVAAAKQNLSTLALDLSIPARIAEAKTLRQRLIGAPRAEVRKVATALKSKLAQVSKAVGAEADTAVAAYDALEPLITPQIEAAEQAIENARLERKRAEAERIHGLELAVDAKLDPWLDRCNEDGMTAERVQRGMDALGQLAMPPELADVAAYWAERMSATRRGMESRRLALAQQEVEAEQAKIRAERARVAGIQARIAEIQAAAGGHDRASSADLAEARMAAQALALTPEVYGEFLPIAAAAQKATLDALYRLYESAVQREVRENDEAIERQKQAALAALPPAPPPRCELSDPGVTVPDAQEGVAQNPLQLEPVYESAGDLAADGAGAETGGTVDEAPAAGRVILVESDANATWGSALRGDGTETLQAGATLIRGEVGTIDAGIAIVGNPPFDAGDEFTEGQDSQQVLKAEPATADATDRDAPVDASPRVGAMGAGQAADAAPAAGAADPRDEFVALVMTAFDCKFPSHPKPSQEWWAKVRAAGLALQA